MEDYIIWLIIGIILFGIEIFTSGFAFICLSIGALTAAIPAYLGEEFKIELLIFAIATLLSFIIVRPICLKIFARKSTTIETNANAMLGKEVPVIEDIDQAKGTGLIKIYGEIWKAIKEDDQIIKAGDKVKIVKIDSTILTVSSKGDF